MSHLGPASYRAPIHGPASTSPKRHEATSSVLGRNPIELGLEISVLSFSICHPDLYPHRISCITADTDVIEGQVVHLSEPSHDRSGAS